LFLRGKMITGDNLCIFVLNLYNIYIYKSIWGWWSSISQQLWWLFCGLSSVNLRSCTKPFLKGLRYVGFISASGWMEIMYACWLMNIPSMTVWVPPLESFKRLAVSFNRCSHLEVMEKQFGEQSGIHQRWWPCLCDFSVGPLSDASIRFFGPCFGCWCQLDRKGDRCGGIRVVFWMGSYWALQMPRFSKLALQNLQNTLIYYTVSKVLAGEKHSQRTERLAHCLVSWSSCCEWI
jgi:hypothetical protein